MLVEKEEKDEGEDQQEEVEVKEDEGRKKEGKCPINKKTEEREEEDATNEPSRERQHDGGLLVTIL